MPGHSNLPFINCLTLRRLYRLPVPHGCEHWLQPDHPPSRHTHECVLQSSLCIVARVREFGFEQMRALVLILLPPPHSAEQSPHDAHRPTSLAHVGPVGARVLNLDFGAGVGAAVHAAVLHFSLSWRRKIFLQSTPLDRLVRLRVRDRVPPAGKTAKSIRYVDMLTC